jgi:DNA primase
MEVKELFKKIIENNDINKILKNLGMHHIDEKDEYFTCGFPDGDNTKSVVIYKDNLWVNAYTRDISDKYGYTNIISLVSFVKQLYFTKSIKWICDICSYNYYEEPESKTEMLKFLNYIYEQKHSVDKNNEDEVVHLKPIDESILEYYGTYANELFLKDNIDLQTQIDFGLGYDLETHSITIPIRDELNTLVGVKARLYKTSKELEEWESKYFYLIPCAKSKILYGLNKTMPYIKREGFAIVCESEKGTEQLWSYGIKNAVSIGSHTLSKYQTKKLTHLGVDIVLAYDKDVMFKDGKFNKGHYDKECNKFLENQIVYCLFDEYGILEEKESPTDNYNKYMLLFENKRILKGLK